MSIFDTVSSGVRARIRLGRPGHHAVEWEPPLLATLFVQKDPHGRACVVSVREREDFAEFDPRHDHEAANLLATEDYLLEVFEMPL